jgi:hypothetical protein
VVEGDNAGMTGLYHADFDPGPQAHFVQAADEVRLSRDFEDFPGFTGLEQMEGDDLHGTKFKESADCDLRLSLNTILILPHLTPL